jgi:mannose-6-phosphate isomerase-like protein (cupin superfamily)
MADDAGATGPARDLGLIGGIGLTHLRVYEQRPGPDGIMSGCAHVHAVTDEAYYVIAGTGAVELNDVEQGFRRVPLARGSYVQFPPDTLHRSVSTGGLEVLAIMTNAGLAERGDARIYFGRAADEDEREYARLAGLPQSRGLDGALDRRDASVRAYVDLLVLWERDRAAYRAELARFTALHRRNMAERRGDLERVIRENPARWLDLALARLDGAPHEQGVAPRGGAAGAEAPRLGMCGLLRPLDALERR